MTDAYRLPPETKIGGVKLQVSDLTRSLAFYAELLGFQPFAREPERVSLSVSGEPPVLIELVERPESRPKPFRTTGLFHVAIRYPDRKALARTLKRLMERAWPLLGFSDHQVSEAIYLADPDGNGLEIYCDRPQSAWPRRGEHIAMTTDPLDIDGLLKEAGEAPPLWEGALPGTDIGHVHLRVSSLARAEAFYHDLLGLDVTQRDYPGALFLSAGGYHHHVGTNVWAGEGIPPPPVDAAGLRSFSFLVPDGRALLTIAGRCREAAIAPSGVLKGSHTVGFALQDPDQTGVEILAPRQAVLPHQESELLQG